MKTKVLLTLDQDAKQNLIKRAEANGLSLSGYVNVLGHASKIYHTLNSPEEGEEHVKKT